MSAPPNNQSASAGRHHTARPIVDRRSGFDRRADPRRGIDIDRRAGADRRAWAGRSEAERAFDPSLDQIQDPRSAALIDIVAGFHEACLDATLWPKCLVALADAHEAEMCAIASHDFQSGAGRLEQSVYVSKKSIDSYAERYARANVWLHSDVFFQTPGAVWTSEQIVSDEDLVSSEFYQNWLKPQGLYHHLFSVLDRQGDSVIYLCLGRSENKGPFGEGIVALLRRLLPNLQRAYRAGEVFRASFAVQHVAANVLDALPIGVMIIGSAGNVISTNRIAQDILVSCDEFAVGKAGVEIEALGQKIRLRDLFSPEIKPKNGKFRDRATNAFSVQRLAGQRPLSVLVSPVSDKLGSKASDEPAAIVYIGDPERILDIDQQRLCQLYGLTRAEARVAALLATGYRLDEAAHHLGLVYETARKHLKHVFGKTGTDRQAELVRLLVTGPAVVRM